VGTYLKNITILNPAGMSGGLDSQHRQTEAQIAAGTHYIRQLNVELLFYVALKLDVLSCYGSTAPTRKTWHLVQT
jgi:hypothetical protein